MNKAKFENLLKELCAFKRFAIKEGQSKNSPSEVFKRISVTDFTSGDVAEILMAYMLGLFSAIADDNLRIYVTTSLDKEGVDFCLKRFRQEYYVQMKFCKHNTKVYPSYVKVVEVGAWRGFKGWTQLPVMGGNEALYSLLVESGAYDEDEIYDIFESCPGFEDECRKIWVHIKN